MRPPSPPQRPPRSRSRPPWGPLAIALLLLAALGVAAWGLRALAVAEVERALRALSPGARYERIAASWPLGMEVRGLRIEEPWLRVERGVLRVHPDPWASLRAGRPCRVRLALRAGALRLEPSRLPAGEASLRRPTGGSGCPRIGSVEVAVRELTVALGGHEGSARSVRLAARRQAGGLALEVTAARARLGAAVGAEGLRATLRRGARGWRLASASAERLRLRVPELAARMLEAPSPEPVAGGPPAPAGGETGETAQDAVPLPELAGPIRIEVLELAGADGQLVLQGSAELAPEQARLRLSVHLEQPGSGLRLELSAHAPRPGTDPRAALRRVALRLHAEQLDGSLLPALLPEVPWDHPEAARLGASLELQPGQDGVDWAGEVSAEGLALRHERLADRVVRLPPLRLAGRGRLAEGGRRLELAQGRLLLGEVALEGSGALWRGEGGLGMHAELALPSTGCQRAVEAIPAALREPELSRFAWKGTLSGRLRLRVEPGAPEEASLRIRVDDRCEFSRVPRWASTGRLGGPFRYRVVAADGTLRQRETGPGSASWVPLQRVSPFFLHALLAAEDAAFFRHHGFAPWAIEEALRRNLAAGRFVLGASTLSMQLARNLFLSRDKTLARKVREVLLTWWLERALSKAEILALYVNVVEFGPDLYGIGAAARHYFGKSPAELTVAEAAFLASVLPSPARYHRSCEEGALTPAMRRRVERLLRHMAERGRIDEVALGEGLAELRRGLRLGVAHDAEADAPQPAAPRRGRAGPLPVPSAEIGEEPAPPWSGAAPGAGAPAASTQSDP